MMSGMIKQLSHVCIHCADLQATRRFYEGLLGLPVKFIFEKEGRLFGLYFEAGNGSFIEAFERRDSRPAGSPHHFCFEVESIDELAVVLDREGVPHREKKRGADQSWQLWTEDPDGHPFEFQEYTPQSSQYTGATCRVDW